MTDLSRNLRTAYPIFELPIVEAVGRLDEQHWNAVDPDGRILDRNSLRHAVADTFRADLARLTRHLPTDDSAARHPWPALIARACDQAVAVAAQTVARFSADRAEIIDALFDHRDPGRLTAIEPTTGDPHQGGRRVSFLHFEGSDEPLVYKPRPLASATLYTSLVNWLNEQLPGLAMASTPTLVKDGYGWAGYVRHEPCRTSDDVEHFYYREGALLALLYAVNGTDAHVENLVACGDQPILIDTETLLHPVLAQRMLIGADPALTALEQSVYRTALLPTLTHGERGALDVSGIGGRVGPAGNRATLPDEPVDPADHVPALLRGFGDAYATISWDSEEFSDLIAGGEDIVTRVVPRQTRLYADLIEECLTPEMLRDAELIQPLFDSALLTDEFETIGPLKQYECRDLERFDIPIFFARRDSRSIWSSDGERIPDILQTSGIDAARAKVRAMNHADRRCQEWVVAAAFATAAGPLDHRCAAPLPGLVAGSESVGAGASSYADWVLDQAFDIARRLDQLAYRDADGDAGLGRSTIRSRSRSWSRVNWLSLEPLEDNHLAILPAGAGLPHGYTGVALFLAQLGAVSGRSEYLERAHEAIAPLPHLLAALAERPAHLAAIGGGFVGLGGIVYALSRLAKLLDSPKSPRTPRKRSHAPRQRSRPSPRYSAPSPRQDPHPTQVPLSSPPTTVGAAASPAAPSAACPKPRSKPGSPTSPPPRRSRISPSATANSASSKPSPSSPPATTTPASAPRSTIAGPCSPAPSSRAPASTASPATSPTPGLMHGLAGVGYGLLRTAFTASVPSVLLMDD